jgi:hypothetical protein
MTAFLVEINQIAAAGLGALLNAPWYAGAVVAVTWVILRLSPRMNAVTRCWIWTVEIDYHCGRMRMDWSSDAEAVGP